MRCNFSNSLLIFPTVMNYLQVSPSRCYYFFPPYIGEMVQIYT